MTPIEDKDPGDPGNYLYVPEDFICKYFTARCPVLDKVS